MIGSGTLFSKAPFVRLMLPLVLGISLSLYGFGCGQLFAIPILIFLALLLFLTRSGSYYWMPYWGILLFLFLVCFGFARVSRDVPLFPKLSCQSYFVILQDYPVEKEKSWQICGKFYDSNHRILVYLPQTEQVLNALPGDVLCFKGLPELVENEGNPFEFDYRRYLNDKGIGYRIFLKRGQFFFVTAKPGLTLVQRALIARAWLIKSLESSGIKKDNVHLIASIAFGARDEVSKETVQSFTSTGVIHILAVSGMNVGLVFLILNLLFGFLKLFRGGNLLHLVLMLAGIWGYTVICGLSASILRAAVMFSFVIIGKTMNKSSGIFNSLALSAFLLSVWQPSILLDVGFQLSYAAITAIAVIQPWLFQLFYFRNRLLRNVWLMASVTCAAQFGTLPLTLSYFHQFPLYFLLANLVVIPLVTAILYLSFVVIFISVFSSWLAMVVAIVPDQLANLVRLTVNFVKELPYAVIESLYPSTYQWTLLFFMGYLFHRFFITRKAFLLLGCLAVFTLMIVFRGLNTYREQTRSEIVFFHLTGTRALALTSGRKTIVLYDKCTNAAEKLGYVMKPYVGRRGISESKIFRLSDSLRIRTNDISVTGNFIFFAGMQIYVEPSYPAETEKWSPGPDVRADLVWINEGSSRGRPVRHYDDSKIILYNPENREEPRVTEGLKTRCIPMNQSVLLTISPEQEGRMSCGYFTSAR